MPVFELLKDDINLAVTAFLEKTHDGIKVKVMRDKIKVKSNFAVELDKLELGSAIPALTDGDWAKIYRQIGKTLWGGRLWPPSRNFDRDETWVIRILLKKTKDIHMRFDPLDYESVKEAAKLSKASVSEFVRKAALAAVSMEFDKEASRRQRERQQEQKAVSQEMKKPYVS